MPKNDRCIFWEITCTHLLAVVTELCVCVCVCVCVWGGGGLAIDGVTRFMKDVPHELQSILSQTDRSIY